MRNPDNYCYCPEFNDCVKISNETDEWITDDCFEDCKDGFLRWEKSVYDAKSFLHFLCNKKGRAKNFAYPFFHPKKVHSK